MAITLIQDPTSVSPSRLHCPAYNDQWFTATSNQTAQPNFQFYITTTIHYYNGTSWTTKVYNDALNNPPDGILRFNVRSYTESFIKHHIPLSTSGWSRCTNGCLKVIVNVGERYGSTPTIYTGTNKTYYVWNAGLSFNEDVGFTPVNYINSNGSAFNLLNDQPDTRLNYYQNGYCYMIANGDDVFKQAIVNTTDGLFSGIDVLTPNETEAEFFSGIIQTKDFSGKWEEESSNRILGLGAKNVIITLGKRGAYVANRESKKIIKGFEIKAVDATAAGDAFNGALAIAMSEGKTLEEAVKFANGAGALAASKSGAQASLCTRKELDVFLNTREL